MQRLVPGLVECLNAGAKVQKPEVGGEQPAFADMITDLLQSVNQVQKESGQMQQAFAEEAGVATDLLLEVRNKLLDAYREIMRMPM